MTRATGLLLGLLAAAVSCTPPPNVPAPLSAEDARHAFTGYWSVFLTLDSLMDTTVSRTTPDPPMRPAHSSGEWLAGSLVIADSAYTLKPNDLLGRFSFPFDRWLGYHLAASVPMAIPAGGSPALFGGNRLVLWLPKDGRVVVLLTPGVLDYSCAIVTTRAGDTLSGYWYEETQGRALAGGQARLVHRP
jgi:hypothetical protein